MQKNRTIPLNLHKDGLVEQFHHCIEQQLAIVSAKHQRDSSASGAHGLPVSCPRLNLLHTRYADVGLFPAPS
ncbi:unnamed protein product [Lota lota]